MAETKVAEMSVSQIGDPDNVVSAVGQHKGVRVFKDVKTVLVEYTDRDMVKQVKLALIIGQEVRFINDDSLSGPVTKQLADQILLASGVTPKKD